MKITVKTLKGGKFDIQAEAEQTVADVKGIIQTTKSELAESALKLIHSGKVLKDDDSLASCGIKENDFLVVMVSKPKKAVAKKETASETPVTSTETASKTAAETPAAVAATTTTSTPAPSTTTATTTPGAPAAADTFPEEVITNLTSMGFPEPEVRHCLRVAHGNPDVAVEFLTNGIPEGMGEAASLVQAASGTPAAATGGGGGGPLQSLRNHPQFNALKRLVQTNPGALQQVLAQIGQQQPDLLAEINANQAAFLEMMNEPISETPAAAGNPASAGAGGLPANMRSPQQMAQLIASMGDAELAQMAQMIGMTPEQLRATAQHASANGVGGGGGETVLRLTPDEMAAVDRLTEMGFDRAEAAQAFLACDKNEALAANLLMDSMGGGGMFGGGGSGDGGGGGGGGGGDGNADDDDNMYD